MAELWVNLTEQEEPTSTSKNELYSCITGFWYVQCDIIYLFLNTFTIYLNKTFCNSFYYIFFS